MLVCPRCGQENPDGFHFCGACGTQLAPPAAAREVRKTVTVLFCDVAGSTRLGEKLDPESLRRVMARYFDVTKTVLESHGGTVEKFIGDAVMAVFGVPAVHEDDALRAVRAAFDMREALGELNLELERDYGVALELRIGVNTGHVVTGTEERLATGDAVNVAKRLEEAAEPGEILLGEETYRLVRDGVEAIPTRPVAAKGKEQPLSPHRLVAVREGAPGYARRLDAPMVGRAEELAQLHRAFDRAERERSCTLFTLLGPAGIGKSRLAGELVTSLGDRAQVLHGRCLSYGDGITFFPLVEMAHQIGGESGEEFLDTFTRPGSTPEETIWAVRRRLEDLAEERPLVAVLDDFHWAEPMLLDLVEHVADLSRDAPIALLCLARPELLERRSSWGGGKLNATAILLEPLSEQECSLLIDALRPAAALTPELRSRVVATAEGNPLFIEQMVAFLTENGRESGDLAMPPTIHALLSERLDRLTPEERGTLESASVIGKELTLAELRAVSQSGTELLPILNSLVRKELLRPARPVEDVESFRFRSLLIRDAAYESLPKQARAELHESFASWMEAAMEDRLEEVQEIVGHHFERAFRYRAELGPVDDLALRLASRAGEHLAAAGSRAYARGDVFAACGLLDSAIELQPVDGLALVPVLGEALMEAGQLPRAEDVLTRGATAAAEVGDVGLEAHVRCALLRLRLLTDPELGVERVRLEAESFIPLFEARGDDLGLTKAWQLVAQTCNFALQFSAMGQAGRRALEHARRARSRRDEAEALFWLPLAAVLGPVPLEEGIALCEELLREAEGNELDEADITTVLAIACGADGRFDEARTLIRDARVKYHEPGLLLRYGATSMAAAWIEFDAADPVAAEAELREGLRILREMGESAFLSTAAAMLAQALNDQGRYNEAEEETKVSEQAASPEDLASQVGWRSQRARALAHLGGLEDAERLAREAVELTRATDTFGFIAQASLALAEVLRLGGRPEEARPFVEQALVLYERKGTAPAACRARELLADLA